MRERGRFMTPKNKSGLHNSLKTSPWIILGSTVILLIVVFVRELFGSGTVWGVQIFPQGFYDFGYENNGFMVLPPMALIVVGLIIWVQRSRNKALIEQE